MKEHCFKKIIVPVMAVLCLLLAGSAPGTVLTAFPADASDEKPAPLAQTLSGSRTLPAADVRQQEETVSANSQFLRCKHYNEKEFTKSINSLSGHAVRTSPLDISTDTGSGSILGGIVPHHLLAGRLIADFFHELAQDPPETVIVLGPNHDLTGVRKIHTSSTAWASPFGTLDAALHLTDMLVTEAGAAQNDELFENEHSVSSLIPYIKYYLPDAQIVPVLLHGSYTTEESKKLGSILARMITDDPGTIVIASTDFSHYLDVARADEMDAVTLEAILSWDLEALSRMGSDNLDSVPSIITLLTAMDAVRARDIDVTAHSNSSRITGSGYDYTTSYFTMFFRRSGQDDTLP